MCTLVPSLPPTIVPHTLLSLHVHIHRILAFSHSRILAFSPPPPPFTFPTPLPLQLKLEKKKLREIWVKISKMHRTNEEESENFARSSSLQFIPPETPVLLNVGGQIFSTTCEVLTRDKFSVLASLCTPSPPLTPDPSTGAFFLERDWWVFRYILQYLRNGTLPRDGRLLEEIYTEASFWRLGGLRREIERRADGRK